MNIAVALKTTSAIITGAGPDKPGIVSAITGVLSRFGCNIEDTTMTRLGHDGDAWFALIIRVSGTAQTPWQDVEKALHAAASPLGMNPQLTPLGETLAAQDHTPQSQAPETFLITVAGADCTGLTHHVAQALGAAGINITDLSAQVIAGETGPVYLMMIEVAKPAHLSSSQAESDISALLAPIQAKLGVEITVRPVDVATF